MTNTRYGSLGRVELLQNRRRHLAGRKIKAWGMTAWYEDRNVLGIIDIFENLGILREMDLVLQEIDAFLVLLQYNVVNDSIQRTVKFRNRQRKLR